LRNSGLRSYRPRQADIICQQRAQTSSNACQIDKKTRTLVAERLNLQWSTEQTAASLPISHETIYQHATQTRQAVAYFGSSCAVKKRNANATPACETVEASSLVGAPIAKCPAFVEKTIQVGHWEGDTVIGTGHKQAIVTLVERKRGFAVLSHVTCSSFDLI
jgi:IS30 family transposase